MNHFDEIEGITNKAPAANPDLLEEALRSGEISIHRARLWSQETPEGQREALWRHRTENGIKKTIRNLVSRHRSNIVPAQPNFDHLAAHLAAMPPNQMNSVKVGVIKSAGGRFILLRNWHWLSILGKCAYAKQTTAKRSFDQGPRFLAARGSPRLCP